MRKNKELTEMIDMKLYTKQRVLFRAFLINIVLVLIVWLLSFWPGFMYFVSAITGMSVGLLYISWIGWLAIWDLAGVAFFLVPALAIYWERKSKLKSR